MMIRHHCHSWVGGGAWLSGGKDGDGGEGSTWICVGKMLGVNCC